MVRARLNGLGPALGFVAIAVSLTWLSAALPQSVNLLVLHTVRHALGPELAAAFHDSGQPTLEQYFGLPAAPTY